MSTIRTFLSSALLFAGIVLTPLIVSACSDDDSGTTHTPTENDAVFIKDPAKRRMIYSLVDLEGNGGRIYEMTYDVD